MCGARPMTHLLGAGAPVRPVHAVREREKDEREPREVKKNATKEKKTVRFADGGIQMPPRSRREYTDEDKEKARKAAGSERYKAYQRAADTEEESEKDSEQRESQNTGGG